MGIWAERLLGDGALGDEAATTTGPEKERGDVYVAHSR